MNDQIVEILFPTAGLHTGCEFSFSTPLWTEVGVNVRGFDPLQLRLRGGSRPGLSPYVGEPVGFLTGTVQDLNVLVVAQISSILLPFHFILP